MAYRVAISTSSFAQGDALPERRLADAGVDVVRNPHGRRLSEGEIIEHLREVDGLIAGLEPLTRAVMQSAKRLRAIARVGIGMDNVDVEAAQDLGIKVSNTPDQPADAVAELTVSAMLTILRGLTNANTAMHERRWEKRIGVSLRGLPVLLIGFGRIGRRVAELLQAFAARVLVVDPVLAAGDVPTGVELVTLDEGLKVAAVVSLHASGADVLLTASEFARMNDGTVLLNSARGGLVDEAALVASLDSGRVGAVWLDVFWDEPYDGRLTEYPQALLTPHMGTYTRQCRRDMELAAVENLLRDLAT